MVRQSEERMRKFSEATDEAIVFHRDGIIIDGNEALTRLTGYPLHEVLGLSIFSFIHPEYRSIALEYTRSGSEHPYEVAITHKDGHNIPVEVVGKTMPQLHGDYRIVVARDISVRKKVEEREAFLALHDALTELPNRRHLMEQLERQIAQAQQANRHLAVLFIDLDHFKTVNDSLGHHAGDQLLCEVAHRFGLLVHLDGARIANATAALGGDVRSFTIDAGVDVVTFGGTKAGMMYGEAVLHLRPELGDRVDVFRKQAGQLPSKMRFVAAQFEALLAEDRWIAAAARANRSATVLAEAAGSIPGVELSSPPEVNAVFARLPRPAIEALQAWSFFWDWDMSVNEVRWMTHFATTTDDIDRFVAGVRAAVADASA